MSPLYHEIFVRTFDHLLLVIISLAFAQIIGIPIGVFAARSALLRPWAIGFANTVQTVPSLAMFGFLIPLPWLGGIGKITAIVALILYALLPIIRNTVTGILSLDGAIIDSAQAMGMTPRQLLLLVQLPLALPVILAGIRIATVTTVGTATIAAAIGAGGLGEFIFRGIASVNTRLLLAGAAPAALMALVLDGVLAWLERKSQRWSLLHLL